MKKLIGLFLISLIFLTGCKTTLDSVIDLEGIKFEDKTFVYDTNEKNLEATNVSSNINVEYENNSQILVGEYKVIANFYVDEKLELTLEATLTIVQNEYDFIKFEDKTYSYNGKEKNLSVSYEGELPDQTEITYENNSKIEVGEYKVTATIKSVDLNEAGVGGYKTLILEATLTILDDTFDLGDVVFEDKVFTYDGTKKQIVANYTDSNITVVYENNDNINSGSYKVIAKVYYRDEYRETLEATLTINNAVFNVTFNSKTFLFDNSVHRLDVEGTYPDNTKITYLNNDKTQIGSYEVTATLELENYETKVLTAQLNIVDSLDITDAALEGEIVQYDGLVKSLVVTNLPSGYNVIYENNNQTEVGEYKVVAKIYKDDVLEVTLTAYLLITEVVVDLELKLNDATFIYDNTNKYLSVEGYLPYGVQIQYDNNSQSEVGEYIVTALVVSLSNSFETYTLTATLKIVARESLLNDDFDEIEEVLLDNVKWSINSLSSIDNTTFDETVLSVSNGSSGASNNYNLDRTYYLSEGIIKVSFKFNTNDISLLSGGLKLYQEEVSSEFARMKFETSRVRLSSTTTSTYSNYTPSSFKNNEWIEFDVLVFNEGNNTSWEVYIGSEKISDTVSFGKGIDSLNKINFFTDSMKNDVSYSYFIKDISVSVFNVEELGDLEVGTTPSTPIPPTAEDKEEVEPDEGNVISVTTITELKSALSSVKAGQTILLEDGTYENLGNYTIQKLSATSSSRITIRARNAGMALFTGTASFEIKSDYVTVSGLSFVNGCVYKQDSSTSASDVGDQTASHVFKLSANYVRISNILVDGFDDDMTKVTYITVTNEALYAEIDHCTFINKNSLGVLLLVERDEAGTESGVMYTHIHNNYFADYTNPKPDDFSNGLETIRVGYSNVSNWYACALIEDNVFEGISGEAELISIKSCGNVIRRNVLINCDSAITLRHGHENIVDSNVILNDGISDGNGIRAFDYHHVINNNYVSGVTSNGGYDGGIILHNGVENPALNGAWTSHDIIISNNTIVNSNRNIALGDNKYDIRPYDITLFNNFVHTAKYYPVMFNTSNGTGTVSASFENEWYYSSNSTFYDNNASSFIDLTTNSLSFNQTSSYISQEDAFDYHKNAGTSTYYSHEIGGAKDIVFLVREDVGQSSTYYTSRNLTSTQYATNFKDWTFATDSKWIF